MTIHKWHKKLTLKEKIEHWNKEKETTGEMVYCDNCKNKTLYTLLTNEGDSYICYKCWIKYGVEELDYWSKIEYCKALSWNRKKKDFEF